MSLISPASRRAMTAPPLRVDHAQLDLLVLVLLLLPLAGLLGVLGRQVLARGPGSPTRAARAAARGSATVSARGGSSPRPTWYIAARASVDLVLLAVDPVPARPADDERERQPLADERGQDHARTSAAGSGCAPGSPAGNARAAASDTAPRSPPSRPGTRAARQRGSRSAIRRRGELGRKLDANTQGTGADRDGADADRDPQELEGGDRARLAKDVGQREARGARTRGR